MKILPFLAIALLASACTSRSDNNAAADTATAIKEDTQEVVADTLYFQKTEGTKHQDTASVQLIIAGNEVTGAMINKPAEKDSRKGTIQATKQGNNIRGIWLFMQEGVQDTLTVDFNLSNDLLSQKGYTYDPKTGREILDEKDDFHIKYQKIEGSKFPKF